MTPTVSVKIPTQNWNSSLFPGGLWESVTTMLKAAHCGISVCVCVSVCIVPAFQCPGRSYSFHLFISRSRVLLWNTPGFLGWSRQAKTRWPHPLPSPPPHPQQQSHFRTSNTLLFQLLRVYGDLTEYPLLHGELARPHPLKLHSAINSSILQTSAMSRHMLLAPYGPAAPASRPPAFPWHQSSGDLTRATLSWRLSL